MSEESREPFVPLPMRSGEVRAATPDPSGGAARPPLVVVYVRYRDPSALEFPDRPERLPGPVFHAAGILLREDEDHLALGEIAFGADNAEYAARYGRDLFPAYRNVLTLPKRSILERRDYRPSVEPVPPEDPAGSNRPDGQT